MSADEGIGQSLGWALPAGGMTAIAGNVVLAARSGDATAFAALVHAETPAAYRLALSIVLVLASLGVLLVVRLAER